MSLTYATLATLMNQPYSGYDIAKQFGSSVGFFWQATHQQIYRELIKLQEHGWVNVETIPQEGRPNKKLYSLTRLGRQKITEWIAQPCNPHPTKNELMVKLFVGYLVDPHILVTELERHRQLHRDNLSVYQDFEQQYLQDLQQVSLDTKWQYLTIRYGICYETSWLAWCEEAIKELLTVPIDSRHLSKHHP